MRQETCTSLIASTQTLHPEHSHTFLFCSRNHIPHETPVVCVHHVNRYQSRVPFIRTAEHIEVYPRMLVAGEAEVPDLPFFLRFERRPKAAALEDPSRV